MYKVLKLSHFEICDPEIREAGIPPSLLKSKRTSFAIEIRSCAPSHYGQPTPAFLLLVFVVFVASGREGCLPVCP